MGSSSVGKYFFFVGFTILLSSADSILLERQKLPPQVFPLYLGYILRMPKDSDQVLQQEKRIERHRNRSKRERKNNDEDEKEREHLKMKLMIGEEIVCTEVREPHRKKNKKKEIGNRKSKEFPDGIFQSEVIYTLYILPFHHFSPLSLTHSLFLLLFLVFHSNYFFSGFVLLHFTYLGLGNGGSVVFSI